jgi:hypothetical protein
MQHLIDLDNFDYEIDDYPMPIFVKFGKYYIRVYDTPQYERLVQYKKNRNGYVTVLEPK